MKLKKIGLMSLGAIFGLSLVACNSTITTTSSNQNSTVSQTEVSTTTTEGQPSNITDSGNISTTNTNNQSDVKNRFTYTFYDEDGTTELKAPSTVDEGTQIVPPSDPTKEATSEYTYEFDGWYTEKTGGTKIETFPTITSNVSYYARYISTPVVAEWKVITAEEYLEAYNKKETLNYNWCEVSFNDGRKCYLKYYNGECYQSPYYTDTIDIYNNLFVWEKINTPFLTGAVVSGPSIPYIMNSENVNSICNVSNDYKQQDGSYEFNGMKLLFEKSNSGYRISQTNTQNNALILTYNDNYFYVNSCSLTLNASIEISFNWNILDLSKIKEKSTYTYTFYDEDGTTELKVPTTVYEGTQIVPPNDPAKEATSENTYEFDGWYTEKTGGTKVETFSTITGNVSYYARYSATPVSNEWKVITVEEFANCYNNSDNSNYTYNHCFSTINGNDSGRGDHYKVEDNVLYMGSLTGIYNNEIGEKKEFIDWREFPSPYNYFFLITSDSISYFKNYKELNEGIYTYNDLAYEIQYLRKGNDEYAIKLFAGTNGTVTYYFNKYFYIIADDNTTNGHTYVWDTIDLSKTINVYTYTFYDDDGTTVLKTKTTYEEGTQIVPPNNPTKEATSEYTYEFDGWYTEKTGGTRVETFSTISSTVSYYARYTATPIENNTYTKKYIFNMSGMYIPIVMTVKNNLVDSIGGLMQGIGTFKPIYDSNNNIITFINSMSYRYLEKSNYTLVSYERTADGHKIYSGDCSIEVKNDGSVVISDTVFEQEEFNNEIYHIKFEDNKVTYSFVDGSYNKRYVTEVNGFCFDESQYTDDLLVRTRNLTYDGDKYVYESIEYDNGNISAKNINEYTFDDNYNMTKHVEKSEDSTGETITTTNYTYNESNEIVSGTQAVVTKDLNDNITDTKEYVYNVETKKFELKS